LIAGALIHSLVWSLFRNAGMGSGEHSGETDRFGSVSFV